MDNVFPWPQLQDESCGRPFNFLVCPSGQNNNCSSGWTCQGSRRSKQNPECSTEDSKAAAISCPSHQSLSYDYKRGIQADKESSLKRSKRSVESSSTSSTSMSSFLQMVKGLCTQSCTFSLSMSHKSKNRAALVEVISGYYSTFNVGDLKCPCLHLMAPS